MNINSVTGDIIGVSLRQLGCTKIWEFNSNMYIVNFELDNGLKVSYVFNITKNDKYFLQRMQPYAMTHGKFASDKEILEFIKSDITKFRNASNSNNFEKFLKITETGNEIVQAMEGLFLNHNVDPTVLTELEKDIGRLITKIHKHIEIAAYIPINDLDELTE